MTDRLMPLPYRSLHISKHPKAPKKQRLPPSIQSRTSQTPRISTANGSGRYEEPPSTARETLQTGAPTPRQRIRLAQARTTPSSHPTPHYRRGPKRSSLRARTPHAATTGILTAAMLRRSAARSLSSGEGSRVGYSVTQACSKEAPEVPLSLSRSLHLTRPVPSINRTCVVSITEDTLQKGADDTTQE